MAAHNWTFDAPTGSYKDRALSSNLRKSALRMTVFMPTVRPEMSLGKKAGESITIVRVSQLTVPTDPRISELQNIPQDTISLSSISITVVEMGRAVPYTSLVDDLGAYNMANAIQVALRDQLALSLDIEAADVYKGAQIKAIPTGVSALTFDTDGTASSQATVNLNTFHVEEIRDFMVDTAVIPRFEDGSWLCIASTKALRGIKRDPKWEQWSIYTTPERKFSSEVGRFEQIRFVETNHVAALSNSLGSGGVLGEAVFFGPDAVVMAMALEPELRADPPQDHGRKKSVAWYGILEFGEVFPTANAGEAKIIHLTSS